MYFKYLNYINSKKIILGSGSIQRMNLLSEMGIKFSVIESKFKENLPKDNIKPEDYCKNTSYNKLLEIINTYNYQTSNEFDIIITADTIISNENGEILEKASSEEEAIQWIESYSNKTLIGYTSISIGMMKNMKLDDVSVFCEKAVMKMNSISKEDACYYVKTGEWVGRAGGIACHLIGKCLIESINGDLYATVGFPVSRFQKEFVKLIEKELGEKNK